MNYKDKEIRREELGLLPRDKIRANNLKSDDLRKRVLIMFCMFCILSIIAFYIF